MVKAKTKKPAKTKLKKPVLRKGNPDFVEMRVIVDAYANLQKSRVQFGNQLIGLERDYKLSKKELAWLKEMESRLEEMESEMQKRLGLLAGAYPIGQWLQDRKGIGDTLSGKLLGLVQDISRFDKISGFWRYCGYGLHKICAECGKRWYEAENERKAWVSVKYKQLSSVKGRKTDKKTLVPKLEKMTCQCKGVTKFETVIEKRRKGDIIEYNRKIKTLLFVWFDSIIKSKGFYRKLYDQFRADVDKDRPDLTKGHRYSRARRKTIKVFLSHLWQVWRQSEKLKVTLPYKGTAHTVIPPPMGKE